VTLFLQLIRLALVPKVPQEHQREALPEASPEVRNFPQALSRRALCPVGHPGVGAARQRNPGIVAWRQTEVGNLHHLCVSRRSSGVVALCFCHGRRVPSGHHQHVDRPSRVYVERPFDDDRPVIPNFKQFKMLCLSYGNEHNSIKRSKLQSRSVHACCHHISEQQH